MSRIRAIHVLLSLLIMIPVFIKKIFIFMLVGAIVRGVIVRGAIPEWLRAPAGGMAHSVILRGVIRNFYKIYRKLFLNYL